VANLAISAVCNQACAYCFTVDHLARGQGDGTSQPGHSFLPLGDFEERLDFLARSGVDKVRLLGGEPTLHPQFPELVARARATGKGLTVFSNGLMPPDALACLEVLPPEACTVLVNVNEPDTPERGGVYQQQLETIRRLGLRAMPGFNIYRTSFRPEFLLALIAETGCKPAIRLSMAQPCLSGTNRYIHPNQYRAVAVKVTRFARVAADAGVSLEFDCGFVRCMFSNADLETLQETGADVGWRCNPILDVDIQGKVLHCYPLARLMSLPLTPTADAPTLRSQFEARTRRYRQTGVYPECSTCSFKVAGECPGGCLAMTIRRFRRASFDLQVCATVAADVPRTMRTHPEAAAL
jgi:MoaA/NifB/PqqE/SkfB family radical SAM enzyme